MRKSPLEYAFIAAVGRSELRMVHTRHEAGAVFAAIESYFVTGLVLVYAIGSTSTAGATLMRWGDVALGASNAAAS